MLRILGLLCLLVSSAHADGFVVVRSDAPLYGQPAADAAKGRVTAPGRPHSEIVFRVVAERPDFLEVETIPDIGHHCYYPPDDMRSVALRAFVRRSDLAPVVTRGTTIPLGDGTNVVLANGLVALPAAAGARRVEGDDWSLSLAVPPAAIGFAYEPQDVPIRASPDSVTTPGPFRVAGQKLFELSYPLPAYEVTRRAKDVLATIVLRCAQIRLSLPPDRLRKNDDHVLGGLVSPEPPGTTVRAGSPIYWLDGGRAGRVRWSFTFSPSPASPPGKRCGRIGELPVCFDDQDVSRATSSAPSGR